MTYGSAHPIQTHHHDTRWHLASWIVSMLALLAAAIGGYIALAPDDGTVTINNRTWAASDLESWGPWPLIVGGALAASGMLSVAIKDHSRSASPWLTSAEAVLALIGAAAAVWGLVLLF